MENLPNRSDDKLTIGRLMVLMAGLGIGLVAFMPRDGSFDLASVDRWRELASASLIGFSLPGVLYATRRRGRGPVGLGGLLWLTLSLGTLLMLPPAVAGPLLHDGTMGSNSAGMCLFYVLPLLSLWFLLAALIAGRLGRRHIRGRAAWTDRFGLYLGLAWSVLGAWLLVDFYRDAFFK